MKHIKIIFIFLSLFLMSSCSVKKHNDSVSIDAKINDKIDAERDAATDKLHDDYLVHVPSEDTNNADDNNQTEEKDSKENNLSQEKVVNKPAVENNNTSDYKQNEKSNDNVTTSDTSNNTDGNPTNENNEQKKEENQTVDTSNDNSVDTNNMDYPIHKGRIDCNNLDDCMNKSLPLQFKYKKIIAKTYYVDVIAKNDNTLGYFIQIFFKEANYGDNESCEKIGLDLQKDIKETFKERNINYQCENGNLKVITDY